MGLTQVINRTSKPQSEKPNSNPGPHHPRIPPGHQVGSNLTAVEPVGKLMNEPRAQNRHLWTGRNPPQTDIAVNDRCALMVILNETQTCLLSLALFGIFK